jgi:cytochrome b561
MDDSGDRSMPGTETDHYSPLAKLLHWMVALLVVALIVVGLLLGELPEGPVQNMAYDLHRSVGVLVFLLMVLRLANRLISGAPSPEPGLKSWERIISSAVHHLLYVLLLVQPILGWVATSAYGARMSFFWLFELPMATAKNEDLAEALFMAHSRMGYAIAGLAAVHVAGALQHYLFRRDHVLQRMAPKGWV